MRIDHKERREQAAQDMIFTAKMMMSPPEPMDLKATAQALGILPADLDVALWRTLGRKT